MQHILIPLFVQPLVDGQQNPKTDAKGASVLTGRHAGTYKLAGKYIYIYASEGAFACKFISRMSINMLQLGQLMFK